MTQSEKWWCVVSVHTPWQGRETQVQSRTDPNLTPWAMKGFQATQAKVWGMATLTSSHPTVSRAWWVVSFVGCVGCSAHCQALHSFLFSTNPGESISCPTFVRYTAGFGQGAAKDANANPGHLQSSAWTHCASLLPPPLGLFWGSEHLAVTDRKDSLFHPECPPAHVTLVCFSGFWLQSHGDVEVPWLESRAWLLTGFQRTFLFPTQKVYRFS